MKTKKTLLLLFITCLQTSIFPTSLHQAALSNNHHLMLGLIKANKNINNTNYIFGMTPLHCAAASNAVDCIKMLSAWGASINKTDKKKRTPLFIAAQEGHAESCSLLLKKKANSKLCDKQGNTPLHAAVAANHVEATLVMLMYGADVLTENNNRISPLLLATQQEKIGILILFFWWYLVGKNKPLTWKSFKQNYIDTGGSNKAQSPFMSTTNLKIVFFFSDEKYARETIKKHHDEFIELKSKYLIKKK